MVSFSKIEWYKFAVIDALKKSKHNCVELILDAFEEILWAYELIYLLLKGYVIFILCWPGIEYIELILKEANFSVFVSFRAKVFADEFSC